MKNQLFVVIVLLSVGLMSCGSSNTDSPEYRQMLEKVQDLEFSIENEWADPLRYSRVNLLGNPNYIRFEGDSVNVFLPYFGERQFGGADRGEGAIQYDGPLRNLKIKERADSNQIVLSFEGDSKTENLDFLVIIYPSGNTRTSVTSSQRDQIDYEGKIIKDQ